MDFAVAFLAALLGLVTIFFTIASLAGAARTQSVNVTGVRWLDDAIVLAIAAVFARWGLNRMWRFFIDLTRPALIDEARVDGVGVHMVGGSHGGYRVWTMTCGSKSWSMPYLDGKTFLHVVRARNDGARAVPAGHVVDRRPLGLANQSPSDGVVREGFSESLDLLRQLIIHSP